MKTQKRKNITSESTVLPDRLSEKVFVIDKNENVTDVNGVRRVAATDSKPFAIPASVIDFKATTANRGDVVSPDDRPYITDSEDIETDNDDDEDKEVDKDFSAD